MQKDITEKILLAYADVFEIAYLTDDMRFEEIVYDSSEEGGVSTMCEVLDRAEARGEARGEAKGKVIGDRLRMEGDARGMYAEGIQPEIIARIQKTTVDVINEILGLQTIGDKA